MPWDAITRIEHNRDHLRYPSDLTDGEWAIIAPFIPPAKSGGRRRTTNMRDVLDALMYLATGGCQWRMLPKDFPPRSTVQRYFYAWREDGFWQSINHILVMETRELNGREASPSAGVIDSQSVKTTESAKGCEVIPRRWVVERTFAWMGRCRRLAKDYETSISSSTVWTLIAHIRKMTRNLARYQFQT